MKDFILWEIEHPIVSYRYQTHEEIKHIKKNPCVTNIFVTRGFL